MFKCKCGNNQFYKSSHPDIYMCNKCNKVYKNGEEIKFKELPFTKTVKLPSVKCMKSVEEWHRKNDKKFEESRKE